MPQLIFLLAAAVVWAIIKALTAPPPPRAQPLPPASAPVGPKQTLFTATTPRIAKPQATVDSQQRSLQPEPQADVEITLDDMARAFVMSELFRPPLAKRLHRR